MFMMWWDRELIRRLEEREIQVLLYQRYVDDVDHITRQRMIGYEAEEEGEKEARANEEVRSVADGIHESIQVTTDYPSKNPDKKIPMLDLKAWLQEIEGRTWVMYEYYHKDLASRDVIHARSAMPLHMKRTILAQEVLRILRNCSRRLQWENVCKHVQYFCARMQYSGHSPEMRAQVVKSALHAYDRMVQRDENGEVPFHRPKEWKKEERMKSRRARRRDWFRGRKNEKESVLFIPVTPGGELKRRFMRIIQEAKIQISVVEKTGVSMKQKLQRSDPFKREMCRKPNQCMVCLGNNLGKCREESVTYQITCSECASCYIGETSRNGFARGLEHRTALRRKERTSPLYQHSRDVHDSRAVQFTMEITGSYRTSALRRQLAESIDIQETSDEVLLNRRDEWRQVLLPRVGIYQDR